MVDHLITSDGVARQAASLSPTLSLLLSLPLFPSLARVLAALCADNACCCLDADDQSASVVATSSLLLLIHSDLHGLQE